MGGATTPRDVTGDKVGIINRRDFWRERMLLIEIRGEGVPCCASVGCEIGGGEVGVWCRCHDQYFTRLNRNSGRIGSTDLNMGGDVTEM